MDMHKFEKLWIKERYKTRYSRECSEEWCTAYRWYYYPLKDIWSSTCWLMRAIVDIAGAIPVRVYILGFLAAWIASC